MFGEKTPRVYLGGRSGPMDISDFIDLVDRNKRVDDLNWQRGKAGNQLSHLCSAHRGPISRGDARNVPTPQIPEFTHFKDQERQLGIIARGWRMLLYLFIIDKWVYPSHELRRVLGDMTWDNARQVVE